jgi:hypothetical protein
MKQITCPHCADTYPDFDVAHVCSRGPYAVKLKPQMNTRIQALIDEVGTDVSGKWLSLEQAQRLAELVAREAALTAGLYEFHQRQGAGQQILDQFGLAVEPDEKNLR